METKLELFCRIVSYRKLWQLEVAIRYSRPHGFAPDTNSMDSP